MTHRIGPADMEDLAQIARPTGEEDYGSDRQVDAENRFFAEMARLFPRLMTHQFESWMLKATTDERIDEAMRLIRADLRQGESTL